MLDWNGSGHDATGPDEPDEELPDQGRPALGPAWLGRTPTRTWWALALVVLMVAGAWAVLGPVRSRPVARATLSSAPSSGAKPADIHIALVRYLALQPGPLSIYIRATGSAGGCPLVQPGTSPQHRITGVVRRALPRFRIIDVGYTLDPSSALCVLQVRARDGTDSTLVLDVARTRGEAAADGLVDAAVSDGFTETEYAFAVTRGGWSVTVGCVGLAGRQPSTKELRDLAQDPGTHW